jgi:hypothetical protein
MFKLTHVLGTCSLELHCMLEFVHLVCGCSENQELEESVVCRVVAVVAI